MDQKQLERLLPVGITNAVVARELTLWRAGHSTWEECLVNCIIVLDDQLKESHKALLEEMQNRPRLPDKALPTSGRTPSHGSEAPPPKLRKSEPPTTSPDDFL